MNVITIYHKDMLQEIIDHPIYLSGVVGEEIEHNMWCIILDESCQQQFAVKDFARFFDAFIKEKTSQVRLIDPQMRTTLYVWFDKQALQLCLNILSGVVIDLPFQCQLQKVSTLNVIVNDFLKTVNNIAQYGDFIEITDVVDSDFDDDDEAQNFVLDVYVVTLNA